MALPWLPEEEIHPVYMLLELPITELLDSEKHFVKPFRSYYNKTWLSGKNNLSVFYYEKATNGAESYHKKLKPYIKAPHPNIWRFMENLNNIISDYDIELQRLSEGQDITRGSSNNTKTKIIHRKDLRERFLNQNVSMQWH